MKMLLTERVYRNGRLDECPVLIDSDDIAVARTVFGLGRDITHFGSQITFRREGWFRRDPVYVIESIERIATMCAAVDVRWNAPRITPPPTET
jgi:hypothetical protein